MEEESKSCPSPIDLTPTDDRHSKLDMTASFQLKMDKFEIECQTDLERKFKEFETFDKMSSFIESKEEAPTRRSEKMTQYFQSEINVNRINATKKTWKKNYFVIILLVKKFINKMKKKIPISKYVIDARHLQFINDQTHFYYGEAKLNSNNKKNSKMRKVLNG